MFITAVSQETKTLSGNYNNIPLVQLLMDIERKTTYQFYYLDPWIENDSVTLAFDDLDLQNILDLALNKTSLNYYIIEDEQRIVLLENTIIYDELPAGFFGNKTNTDQIGTNEPKVKAPPPPPFYTTSQTKKTYPVAKIGKSDLNDLQERYVLTGKAINAKSGELIQDLTIRVKGTNLATVTDATGTYTLLLPVGYHILNIRAMGIASTEREIIMYNNGSLNLFLEEGLQQLDEVVVEADAFKNVEEAITGSEQIDSETSKNIPLVLGERDILQVAKALPGISSAGEGATGLNVRGGKTDQNLVLLDDAVIYTPQHFFGIFQALNPFTTKGVEIYKGAIPVEFGGRLSSVFDIRTKNGNVEKFSGEGSIGPVTGNLALEIPLKKDRSSLIIGGRGAYADWILKSLDEESLKNSNASFFDGIVKYHDKLDDNNEIKATAYYSRDAFSITSDSLYNYSNRLFSARWDHRINDKTTNALIIANSNYGFGIDYESSSNTDFDLDYSINETEVKYKIRKTANDKHTLDYGISAKYYGVNPGSLEPKDNSSAISPIYIDEEQAVEGALFIGDELKVNDKLTINMGVRLAGFAALGSATQRTYEENSPKNESTVQDTLSYGSAEAIKTYGGPEARISARYLLAPDFSVKASINNSYQFLHTLSNNTTVSPIDTWKLSDLNISPQTGYQASLGFYKNLKDNMFEISLEGYYKRMQNVLDFKTGANLFLNENVETQVLQGDGKAYGVELLLKKKSGNLNGWLGYTYSRSFYKFDSDFSEERINNGNYFPSNFDKPHDVSLVTNYKFSRRYSVSANFVYQTGRPITYPIGTFRYNNSDYVAFSDRNAFRIPDFYRLDLGVNIEGNHKKNKLAHSFVTISVYNVLGRNNPYSVFFVTDDGEVKALQSSIFAIPIPSITYNFKF
ncbi:Outer membrane receptor proteins, mostly Fe transport [Maribacter sedimenticola]|uniref:Outer membrane receptor proteins, mostly Fe transport n=1 Tax=Maribacter sedimenticola TaxID=228956 RepID=A0ABY1SD62_9FLAO|nr:carboxypeptidase-like regulatory domain-containing protein [Maribacter sedimenticola]SNR26427.1 Outer membrane receptor proteins, mostly Fe transport [Maribacter sedimenticola]